MEVNGAVCCLTQYNDLTLEAGFSLSHILSIECHQEVAQKLIMTLQSQRFLILPDQFVMLYIYITPAFKCRKDKDS